MEVLTDSLPHTVRKDVVKVVLTNRKAQFVEPFPYDRLNEILRYRIDGWQYSPQGKAFLQWVAIAKKCEARGEEIPEQYGWDGFIRMVKYGAVSSGVFLANRRRLEEELEIKFLIEDHRKLADLSSSWVYPEGARKYQLECVEKMRKAKTGGLILNATGCLIGDTLIDCPRNLSTHPYGILIKDLVGKKPWVYCWDESKSRIALSKASQVWKSGTKVPVYKVTFQVRGFSSRFGSRKLEPLNFIIGTADHPFLLYRQKIGRRTNAGHNYRSVDYVELKKLKVGDRVMALHRSFGMIKGGYSYIHLNDGTGIPEHRFIASEILGEKPDGWHAHHNNDDGLDNRIENIVWKTHSDHASHHTKMRNKEGTFTGWRATGIHPRGMLGKKQFANQKKIARDYMAGKKYNNHVVEKVEFAGYQDVYNMTVPGQENFIANGVVTHNTGKTYIAGLYSKGLEGRLLFVVDELTLLKQAREEIAKVCEEEVGEIGDSVFAPRRVTVGTIQTVHLHRTDPKFRPWSRSLQVIILDEIHLALNKRNLETLRVIQPKIVFGLTATLELKKQAVAMKSYELAGPVIFDYPLEQGVREGFLSHGVAISVQVHNEVPLPSFSGGNWTARRRFYARQYPEMYRKVIVESSKRNDVIVKLTEQAHQLGKYIIILVERVKHIKLLDERLAHLPHETVFGEKAVNQRVLSKLKFEVGQSRVLITNKVFKKGVDIKRVDVIIDAAGMKSRNDAVQKYGRGVRLCKEKNGLIYFDISDVDNRFEKAGKGRVLALKQIGVPVFRVESEIGAEKILKIAESKLQAVVAKPPTK